MNVERLASLLLATPALLGVLALSACGANEPVTSPTPPTTDTSTDSTDSTAGTAPLPPSVDVPVQGGTYGAVVLSDGDDAARTAAEAAVAELGSTAYDADLGCLQGAAEALDLPGATVVSHLLFETTEQAEQWAAAAADRGVSSVGTAEVRAYCLD